MQILNLIEKHCVHYAREFEKFFYDYGIIANCKEIHNVINLVMIFEVNVHIGNNKLATIKNGISLRLQIDVSLINLNMFEGQLILSINSSNNEIPIIHFNTIHNQDIQARGLQEHKNNILKIPVGYDMRGNISYLDFNNKENLFIVGSSQNGKSNAINYIIASMLLRNNEISLILVDCFKKKFRQFNKINNCRVVSNFKDINACLDNIIYQIDYRYNYNKGNNHTPLFLVVDEFQNHIDASKDIASKLETIASTGLECNIFVILATQRLNVKISKSQNLNNNCLKRIYFRIDKNSKLLYNIDGLEALGVGACYIVDNNKQVRSQFGLIPEQDLSGIINYIENKQPNNTKKQGKDNIPNSQEVQAEAISKHNIEDFEAIKEIPNNVLAYLVNDCLNTGLVSASKMRKAIRCNMTLAVSYCKELERLDIIQNLGGTRGRLLTTKGKEYLRNCLQYNTQENNTEEVNIIPLFD